MSPYYTQASRYKWDSRVDARTLGDARGALLKLGVRVALPVGVEEAVIAAEKKELDIQTRVASAKRRGVL